MTTMFVERVMTAVAEQPRPTPMRSIGAAIVHLSPRDAAAALWTGWRLATMPDRRVTPRAHVGSSALLVTIMAVLVLGVSFAAADRFLLTAPAGPASRGPERPAAVEDVQPVPSDPAADRKPERDHAPRVRPRPQRAVSPGSAVVERITTHAQRGSAGARQAPHRRTDTADHHVVRGRDGREDDRQNHDREAEPDDHGGGSDDGKGPGSGDDHGAESGGSDGGEGGTDA